MIKETTWWVVRYNHDDIYLFGPWADSKKAKKALTGMFGELGDAEVVRSDRLKRTFDENDKVTVGEETAVLMDEQLLGRWSWPFERSEHDR